MSAGGPNARGEHTSIEHSLYRLGRPWCDAAGFRGLPLRSHGRHLWSLQERQGPLCTRPRSDTVATIAPIQLLFDNIC